MGGWCEARDGRQEGPRPALFKEWLRPDGVSITWELVIDANSRTNPSPTESELLGVRPRNPRLNQSPARSSSRSTALGRGAHQSVLFCVAEFKEIKEGSYAVLDSSLPAQESIHEARPPGCLSGVQIYGRANSPLPSSLSSSGTNATLCGKKLTSSGSAPI